jgi:iron complex transport system ATP-binding protein
VRPPLLEIEEASVILGRTLALDGLSLIISEGEHTAILGPNGSGKSTLLRLLALEVYPSAVRDGMAPDGGRSTDGGERKATVRIFGRQRWDVSELRSRLGIVSADLHDRFVHGNAAGAIAGRDAVLSGFTATQGLFFHQRVTGTMRRAALDALDAVGVAHLAETRLDRMSTGEARRVLIARALVHKPTALVLDEPTRGLDVVAQHDFMERVRGLARGGTTIVLVTHQAEEIIPEIDRVILLSKGRVAYDGTKARVLTAERLSEVFGARLAVVVTSGYYRVRVAAGEGETVGAGKPS